MLMTRICVAPFMFRLLCLFFVPVFQSAAATKDSRQLLIDILQSTAVGETTCEHVRKLCGGIEKGTYHDSFGIKQLASIPKTNFMRDLHRWSLKQDWRALLPNLYEFTCEFLSVDGLTCVNKPHFFILPHEVFNTVFQTGDDLFAHVFGSDSDIADWWKGIKAKPDSWYRNHPIIQDPAIKARMIPLGMHGDDGGMIGAESTLVISWNSVAFKKTPDWNRLLFTMVNVATISPATLQTVYGILRWSFDALAAGVFPAVDFEGRPFSKTYEPQRWRLAGTTIAGGQRGLWSEMRGDWKYLKEALHFQFHASTRPRICHLCEAEKRSGELCYANFAPNAGHRATVTTSDEFRNAYLARAYVSPLLLIIGFCIFRVFFDLMHTLDLGVFQYVIPSCLWELTSKRQLWNETTRQKRFQRAYAEYRVWCKAQKVKSVTKKRFSFGRFRPSAGKYPFMSQVTAKAAATRSMSYWVNDVCQNHTTTHHDKVRAGMMMHFIQADIVCRRAGRYFTDAEKETFSKHMQNSLRCYNALAAEAVNLRKKNWKLVPKFHALQHIISDFGNLNPRRCHCYADEDMVGKMKRIFVGCHANTACLRSLEKYAILLCLRWWITLHNLRGIPTQL
jgi:hypothetical protein